MLNLKAKDGGDSGIESFKLQKAVIGIQVTEPEFTDSKR